MNLVNLLQFETNAYPVEVIELSGKSIRLENVESGQGWNVYTDRPRIIYS